MSKPIGDPMITQRRITRNSRYNDVKSQLRTGRNVGNTAVKVDRSKEIFKRIKRTALGNLMHDSENLDDTLAYTSSESGMSNSPSKFSVMSFMTNTTTMSTQFDPSTELLLVDIRDRDEYAKYHIDGALNFPMANLRRDAFTSVFYEFKNRPGKIIVIYSELEDTRQITAAKLFTEKRFENSYMLSGGLKYFSQKFQNRIKPELPAHLKPKKARRTTASKTRLTAANLSQGSPASSTKKILFKNRKGIAKYRQPLPHEQQQQQQRGAHGIPAVVRPLDISPADPQASMNSMNMTASSRRGWHSER